MATLIQDREVERELIRDRRERGLDRWDEVWEGTYVIMPLPNNEHQELVGEICRILKEVVRTGSGGRVFPGCNVSDRGRNWMQNFRCPDVAVYLAENPAVDHGTHWQGGPDLAIEIVSPDDRSFEKLEFYGSIGTRELLILDRDPWRLELYRRTDGGLSPVMANGVVATETVALQWSIGAGAGGRLQLDIADAQTQRRWSVSAD